MTIKFDISEEASRLVIENSALKILLADAEDKAKTLEAVEKWRAAWSECAGKLYKELHRETAWHVAKPDKIKEAIDAYDMLKKQSRVK